MKYIDLSDFLLVPLYGLLLFLIIRPSMLKYRQDQKSSFFVTAFVLHLLGSVLYAMVIQYYYGSGDSFGFFTGSRFLHRITVDEGTLKYFFYSPEQLSDLYFSTDAAEEQATKIVGSVINNSSNLAVMKISAVLSFFAFNRYIIISIFFGFFSFLGIWRLFISMNDMLKGKSVRLLALTVLYTPSMWFWGSGLIKDSICIGSLGFIVHALYNTLVKKQPSLKELIIACICTMLILEIKPYIAAALAGAVIFYTITQFISRLKSVSLKVVSLILILGFIALMSSFFMGNLISGVVEDAISTIDTYKSVYQSLEAEGESGSNFASKNLDFSVSGLLLNSPFAILTTLFRPFLWEVRSVMMIFSSLESSIALFALLYLLVKVKLRRFVVSLFSTPYIVFSLVFVVVLSLIIGYTTFNFGTMVRYRIPVLPFYSFLLISIFVKYTEAKNQNTTP